jgi:xanthine dehydrogenase accessory factor
VTTSSDRTPPLDHGHAAESDCATAHGEVAGDGAARHPAGTLVAVYAGPVAEVLLRWGRELGYRTVLVDPDPARPTPAHLDAADEVFTDPSAVHLDDATDVVVTDHHRDDLGPAMAPLVQGRPRWIGIMGSPRHEGPHRAALADEGVAEDLVATVHRPIGLDIGSRTPPEIALSTLAGLVAARTGRAGGTPADVATR